MAARSSKKSDGVVTTDDLATPTPLDSGPTPNATVTADEPYLDPELARIRDEELKRMGSTELHITQDEPYLDPQMAEQRDAAMKAWAEKNK